MHILEYLESLPTRPESAHTPTFPGAALYRAFDEWAVEREVAEMLYALVVLLKPGLVIESGAGSGMYSTRALASAVSKNSFSMMVAFEPDEQYRKRATEAVRGNPKCQVRDGDSRDLAQDERDAADFVFLDSYPGGRREREILFWLYRRVTLVIHDAYRYNALLDRQPGGQFFSCPRGLWIRAKRMDHGQDQQRSDGLERTEEAKETQDGDRAGCSAGDSAD